MNFSNLAISVVLCSIWMELVVSTSLCGNGVINSPEECDDGNYIDGDGCSSLCKV